MPAMKMRSSSSARSISGMPPRRSIAALKPHEAGQHHARLPPWRATPPRPAELAAEHQRHDQAEQSGEQHDRARQIEPRADAARHRRHQPSGGERDADADRHVDAEDAAPAQAGEVQRHQPAAEHEADGGAEADRDARRSRRRGRARRRGTACGSSRAPAAPSSPRRRPVRRGRRSASAPIRTAPHHSEASVKPRTPVRNTRLRPKMSPRRPPVITSAA